MNTIMKYILTLTITIYGLQALPTKEASIAKWENFKITYGNKYDDNHEEAFRKELFLKQLQHIEEHNEKFDMGLVSYKIGINKFSDYTEEEKRLYTQRFRIPQKSRLNAIFSPREDLQLPESIDWREKGMVPPVKDQGLCGSCWAFSAIGALECHYRIHKNLNVSLSEQQLVDCVESLYGCSGGWMDPSFQYIEDNGGINTETDYPYEAVDGKCRYNSEKAHYTVSGYVDIPRGSEKDLQAAVAEQGPVSVAIDPRGDFDAYESGVYYNPDCDPEFLFHSVVVVGYGNEDGQDYWLVRNSYSDQWGDKGYIKMARNRDNHCGIANVASYPLL